LEQMTSIHKLWLPFVLRLFTARYEVCVCVFFFFLHWSQPKPFSARDAQTHNFQIHTLHTECSTYNWPAFLISLCN
jgi:hypothetical protein